MWEATYDRSGLVCIRLLSLGEPLSVGRQDVGDPCEPDQVVVVVGLALEADEPDNPVLGIEPSPGPGLALMEREDRLRDVLGDLVDALSPDRRLAATPDEGIQDRVIRDFSPVVASVEVEVIVLTAAGNLEPP